MKKYLYSLFIMFLLILTTGCTQEKVSSGQENTATHQKKAKNKEDTFNDQDKEKLEAELKQYFLGVEEAVKNKNYDEFMKFQNPDNPLFYREQARWIKAAILYGKTKEATLSIGLYDIQVISETQGFISFVVTMGFKNSEPTNNHIQYQIIKTADGWKINDLPFQSMNKDNITFYYLPENVREAEKYIEDTFQIVQFYKENYRWNPDHVDVKLFTNREALAASVPFPSLSGESGDMDGSFKTLLLKDNPERTFSIFAHELTHRMLMDFTNDNLTSLFQEGLATYMENGVKKENGKLVLDKKSLNKAIEKVLAACKHRYYSLETLINIDSYDDKDINVYAYGFLVTNFLIETEGFNKMTKFEKLLKQSKYIDNVDEHKSDMMNKRTLSAFEKVYGNLDQLSAAFKEFYKLK
ncbi:hypothetical protein AN964_12555 [Heyndrickxia shackletonii]|uniref:Peptidase MA superfamily protein n=1 Tax=Heyndrickxia shackletonii TaxID=157838 RepID=A0A0Q3TKV7_9BACI|nr:collagenase [Heyndrickxia shackletonii]KQL54241.1 hypothetical protein AN964_12555 [Heyndrickxia shackletonii]NEZ00926.1 hypothetical protein [Heyndrickxia shackletonii]